MPPSDVKSFVDQFVANPSNSLVDIGYALGLPQYIEIASETHNGVLGYSTVAPLPNPEGIAWKKRFEKRFGREPGNISGTAYDGVMIWANAVKAVNDVDNHTAIAEYIAANVYKGLNGTYDYTITDDHTVRADAKNVPMHYFQLQNGNRVLVSLGTEFRPDFKFQKPKWIKK